MTYKHKIFFYEKNINIELYYYKFLTRAILLSIFNFFILLYIYDYILFLLEKQKKLLLLNEIFSNHLFNKRLVLMTLLLSVNIIMTF